MESAWIWWNLWKFLHGFVWFSDVLCMDLLVSLAGCSDRFLIDYPLSLWVCGHTKGDLLHCLWSLCEAYGRDPARAICSVGALDQKLLLDLYDICFTISYISYTISIYMWYLVLYIYIYICKYTYIHTYIHTYIYIPDNIR